MNDTIERMSAWLHETALPFWGERTWDAAHGGCVEALAFDGSDAAAPFKRTRVACRQIYVFSHAALLGWDRGLPLARKLIDHLTGTVWQGYEYGFARRMTRAGAFLDTSTDLYDHSFALFAFAWHFRATGEDASRVWAANTMDFIETRLRHPTQPGFMHEASMAGWRQQNPHMHLAEATLAAFEATGERRYERIAREVIDLFRTSFFDPRTGALREFFTSNLQPAMGEDGRRVEPGHQFEWAWILQSAQRLLELDLSAEIRALVGFAERHGVSPQTGLVCNAVREDGSIVDATSRSWPNTERLKAAVALFELDGTDPTPVIEQTGRLLLDRFLDVQTPGLWVDHLDAEASPIAANVPTSILYHLVLAFAECIRIAPRLSELQRAGACPQSA